MIESEHINNKHYLKIIMYTTIMIYVLKNINLNTHYITFLILKLFVHVSYG